MTERSENLQGELQTFQLTAGKLQSEMEGARTRIAELETELGARRDEIQTITESTAYSDHPDDLIAKSTRAVDAPCRVDMFAKSTRPQSRPGDSGLEDAGRPPSSAGGAGLSGAPRSSPQDFAI